MNIDFLADLPVNPFLIVQTVGALACIMLSLVDAIKPNALRFRLQRRAGDLTQESRPAVASLWARWEEPNMSLRVAQASRRCGRNASGGSRLSTR